MRSVRYEGSDGSAIHPSGAALDIEVPPGRSSLEVGLAVVEMLVDDFGATVERADMYPDGLGRFSLSIRGVGPDGVA